MTSEKRKPGDDIREANTELAWGFFGTAFDLMGIAMLFGWAWAAKWALILIIAGIFVTNMIRTGANIVDSVTETKDWVVGKAKDWLPTNKQ